MFTYLENYPLIEILVNKLNFKQYALKLIRDNGFLLFYINEQTEELCLETVKKNGHVLSIVKEKLHKYV